MAKSELSKQKERLRKWIKRAEEKGIILNPEIKSKIKTTKDISYLKELKPDVLLSFSVVEEKPGLISQTSARDYRKSLRKKSAKKSVQTRKKNEQKKRQAKAEARDLKERKEFGLKNNLSLQKKLEQKHEINKIRLKLQRYLKNAQQKGFLIKTDENGEIPDVISTIISPLEDATSYTQKELSQLLYNIQSISLEDIYKNLEYVTAKGETIPGQKARKMRKRPQPFSQEKPTIDYSSVADIILNNFYQTLAITPNGNGARLIKSSIDSTIANMISSGISDSEATQIVANAIILAQNNGAELTRQIGYDYNAAIQYLSEVFNNIPTEFQMNSLDFAEIWDAFEMDEEWEEEPE